jgi:hypothetical protein
MNANVNIYNSKINTDNVDGKFPGRHVELVCQDPITILNCLKISRYNYQAPINPSQIYP